MIEMPLILAMQTLDYLREFAFARQAFIAAIFLATASAALSPIVVLKRLAFVGQGISHAAFGGIGVVVLLGLAGLAGEAVIFAFCLGSALLIARLSGSRTREDTAIGIVLVGTMALGFMLVGLRLYLMRHSDSYRALLQDSPTPAGWDSILFGSVTTAGSLGAWMSAAIAALILVCLWWWHRPLLAFVFDETAAMAAGVNGRAMRNLLMTLLALVVVVGIKVVGVILISAMLILPGAIAARFSRTLAGTLLASWVSAVVGVVGGLVVSFEFDALPAGPAIVLVMIAQFALAMVVRRT